MNLDNLLKKIEQNVKDAEEQKTFKYTADGEEYEVLTLTRNKRKELVYAISEDKMTQKQRVKILIPYIYESFQLQNLATKAKADGFINTYYDIVELLFKPEEIFEITGFIFQINNIYGAKLEEDIEQVKKQ